MTIEELYKKVIADEELRKACAAAAKDGKVAEFLSENGCTSTKEEIKAFLKAKRNCPMTSLTLCPVETARYLI